MRYWYNTFLRSISQAFLFDKRGDFKYFLFMAKITYNTRMEEDLIKRFKILAINLSKRQNQLLEEAIQDILKKYQETKE